MNEHVFIFLLGLYALYPVQVERDRPYVVQVL